MTSQAYQDRPSHYSIKVRGFVSRHLANNMGLSLDYQEESEGVVTTLCGPVVDQAALMGILNNLYGLGFTLLAVENI